MDEFLENTFRLWRLIWIAISLYGSARLKECPESSRGTTANQLEAVEQRRSKHWTTPPQIDLTYLQLQSIKDFKRR
jgi:hypothetical protein